MAGFPKCHAMAGNVSLMVEMLMPPGRHSDHSVGALADTVPETL